MEPDYKARADINSLHIQSGIDDKLTLLNRLLVESLREEYNPFKNTIFPNTPVHRRKLRIWQSILMLSTVIDDMRAEDAANLLNLVWQAIDGENMASTRYYMEFLAIRIVLRHEVLVGMLWERVRRWHASASAGISALIVAYHVGRKMHGRSTGFVKFFDLCVPYFLHNSHTVRIYATKIYYELYKLYYSCEEDQDLSFKRGSACDNVFEFIGSSEACERFVQKLDGDHFLCRFDPVEDFNLHFLVSELPKRSEVAHDETYPGIVYDNSPLFNHQHHHQLKSVITTMNRTLRPLGEETSTAAVYQQKIVPFELGRYDLELSEYNQQQEEKWREQRDGKIIMCASLVEKTPNLAGLSRTCEILGATQLIVPSASILDSTDFKNISMTSDRWLTITECKPANLCEQLLQWRMQSFRIVAVEQTSDSVSLERFEFAKRVVLVLGGESQGIPAHVLQIVDECVEIPQFGLTRSLNVHVSGSLVLWELRRQRILSNNQQ